MTPLKVFSGTAHPRLAESICDTLGIPPGEIEIQKFSNDNTFVRVRENVRQKDVFIVQPSSTPVNDGLMELFLMIDAMVRASARSVTVVMPYYAYGRSDKKDQPRIPITASLVARLLETAGADRILTMDLHAEQIQGFFKVPVDQLIAAPVIAAHYRQRDLGRAVAVAPDAGSARRVREYARRLGLPMAIMDKRRRENTDSAEVLHVIGDVDGRHAIIFDDEIATGGSIISVAETLMANGARSVRAAVTHPILCGRAIERLAESPVEELVVTDTVPIPPEKRISKVQVLSVAHVFGEAIRRIHGGQSLTDLFD